MNRTKTTTIVIRTSTINIIDYLSAQHFPNSLNNHRLHKMSDSSTDASVNKLDAD